MADTIDDQLPDDCGSSDSHCSGAGSKLYQITSGDLEDLERLLPQLFVMLGVSMNQPHVRTKIQRVKNIVSEIRWEGLPWKGVEIIPAGDEPLPG